MTTFKDLGLSEPILQALSDVGYESPSPIQEQAIPELLQGHDVIGQAQTGTGKT
ncbi:MAG: ATP-dependent helicase DeaD, partial [Solirubrobacteraceae bacterium]|nr:ATP-dependent helicase DeaD [Solirubrobacteraceae bacterium]